MKLHRRPYVWLASYPKSGNTWMRLLLANYWSESRQPVHINRIREALPLGLASRVSTFEKFACLDASEMTRDEIEDLRPAICRVRASRLATAGVETFFYKIHDALHLTAGGELLVPVDRTAAAVYLVRCPLDVAVSWAFYDGCSFADAVDMLCDPSAHMGGSVGRLRQRLLDWSGHIDSWRNAPFPVLVARYEDLLADAAGVLGRVVRFLGLDGRSGDSERIRRAAKCADFAELRRQEDRDGFREAMPSSRFFRLGKQGEWRRHLTPEQVQAVVVAHGSTMASFRYSVP